MCINPSCGIHVRQSQEEYDDSGAFQIIDYHGDYCVVTTENGDPVAQLMLMQVSGQYVNRFCTWVYRVGDGVLADIVSDLEGHEVFRETHDVRENVKGAHQLVLALLKDDGLELTES